MEEYSDDELINLVNSKAVNGKISLENIAQIVFDIRFPKNISKNAETNLRKMSNEFDQFKTVFEILIEKYNLQIILINNIIELQNTEYVDEETEERVIQEILKLREQEIINDNEIADLQNEIAPLRKYFSKL